MYYKRDPFEGNREECEDCNAQLQEFRQSMPRYRRYIASKRRRIRDLCPFRNLSHLDNTVKKIYIPRLIEYSLEARVAREKKKTDARLEGPLTYSECLTIVFVRSACTCSYLVPFTHYDLSPSIVRLRKLKLARTERARKKQENVT